MLITVLATSGVLLAFAATPSTTFTISPGIYPATPSLTVWRETNTYYAKNVNGELVYESTNASDLIADSIALGGHIHIKKGTYLLSNAIIVTSNTTVTGEGIATILKVDDNANCNAFTVLTADNIVIRDLQCYGNKDNNSIESGGTNATICVTGNCSDIILENLWVYNGSDGIKLRNTENCIIQGCIIKDCKFDGVVVSGYANNTSIVNNIIENNCLWGIEVCGGIHQGVSIVGNQILGTETLQQRGIVVYNGQKLSIANNIVKCGNATSCYTIHIEVADVWPYSYAAVDSSITGNVLIGGKYCVYIKKTTQQPQRITFTGNTLCDFETGLYLSDVDDSTFMGNTFFNGSQGIYMEDSNRVILNSNNVLNVSGKAVKLHNCWGCIVDGNNIAFYDYGIYLDISFKTIVTANFVSSGNTGYYETATSEYSLISADHVYDNSVVNISMLGTGSNCTGCFNGTTWIP